VERKRSVFQDMAAGRRFEVEVCFADGAAPACATFMLVVHPGLGMQQVKVFRQTRPVSYYQQVAEEAEAEVQQCRMEVRQLRAEQGVPDGLTGASVSGLVNSDRGIDVKNLKRDVTEAEGNAVRPDRVFSSRARERVAVTVDLVNPGTTPWTAVGAVLRGPRGEVLKPLPLWRPAPILPGLTRGRVVVEVLATEKQARGVYTLVLWDESRAKTVTLGNVTFP